MIVSAGYRIGPAEVESTLLGHPAVREVAVIGVPDPQGEIGWRSSCWLRVRRFAGADRRAAGVTCEAETAPYKYPREILFVDALPKTTSGKIHRAAVRSEHAGRT